MNKYEQIQGYEQNYLTSQSIKQKITNRILKLINFNMSDQERRFIFNPPQNENQVSENNLDEREQSFSHPFIKLGDSMEAAKQALDVTDPKSNTTDFERDISKQFASRGGDTTNQLVSMIDKIPKSNTTESEEKRDISNQFASRGGDTTNQLLVPHDQKNLNNSLNSIRRSPFSKFRKETKKDVKQLLGKPPSSGRESLGQASGLPALYGTNISRTSLVSQVKKVNLREENNQSQQPIQWAQTAKFNEPNKQQIQISDMKDSEDQSAEPILTSAEKKQQELKQRIQQLDQELNQMKEQNKKEDQKLNQQNLNASISSFNNLVSSNGHQSSNVPPIDANQPEQPSEITVQKTNIAHQDQIIQKDEGKQEEPELNNSKSQENQEQEVKRSMPDFPSSQVESIPDQFEQLSEYKDPYKSQPGRRKQKYSNVNQFSQKNQSLSLPPIERPQVNNFKVSFSKDDSTPEEVINSRQNDFNTPKPETEEMQIMEQITKDHRDSNQKSLTNKSLVLSSKSNVIDQQQEQNLKIESSEIELQKENTSPYIVKKDKNMKKALETMDPHFEGSQQSRQDSASLTPIEDSDNGEAYDGLRHQYNSRMQFENPNMGIILGKTLDEGEYQTEIPMGKVVKTQEEIEEEKREYEEISKLGESLWLTDKFVDKPKTVIAFGGLIISIMIALCLGLRLYWPSLVTVRDLLDYSDIHTLLFDARRAAFGEIQRKSSPDERITLQSVIDNNWQLLIGIECVKKDCDNILTPEGLQFLYDIDELINNDTMWHKICLQDSVTNKTCMDRPEPGGYSSKASPLTIFKILFGNDLEEMTQFGIDFALFGLAQELEYFNLAIPLFGSEFTRNNRQTKLVRMALTFAGPIEIDDIRFNNMEDRQETQEFIIANWQADLNDKLLILQADKYPGYVVHTFGRSYYYRQFYRQLIWDVLWSGLAVLFCFCYVFFHTKSLFVTTNSMAMILYSFPITLVIYKLIMGVSNVSSLHLLIVFVVLGISCDNIFVVYDAWEQSEMYPQFAGSLHKRMAYTFRRASLAILATSSTTAFAFLSNGFSKLMPVSAFGYFAFCVIPVNYILIVFYFPAFLIVYEKDVKQIEKRTWLLVTGVCSQRKNKVGLTDSGGPLEGIEIIEQNSLNLRNDKIQTRFEDESFITNQIFQTQRGSHRGSLKQSEYYEYMQQYYQVKQKEAKLAAIISSHQRNPEDLKITENASPKPRSRKSKLRIKRNSEPTLKLSKKKVSSRDSATIESVGSHPSKSSKDTLINSRYSSLNELQQIQNKRYNTAASQEIITEEDNENEELKEGGDQDSQDKIKEQTNYESQNKIKEQNNYRQNPNQKKQLSKSQKHH